MRRPHGADAVPRARADVAPLLAVPQATDRPALVAASRVLGTAGEDAVASLALGAVRATVRAHTRWTPRREAAA